MSNNEAPPERIWLPDNQPAATWTDFQQNSYTEYIRADLHAERIAELEAMTSVRRIGELNAKVAELEAERDALKKENTDLKAKAAEIEAYRT